MKYEGHTCKKHTLLLAFLSVILSVSCIYGFKGLPGAFNYITEFASSKQSPAFHSLLKKYTLPDHTLNFPGLLKSQTENTTGDKIDSTKPASTPEKARIFSGPIFSNLFILWIACLVIGLLSGAIVALIYNTLQKTPPLLVQEIPEEDKPKVYDLIKTIESEITNKNFSISHVTSKLALTVKEINVLTKRVFKRSFNNYVLALRIEIVKERLRSSNASEIFITKSCGFSSVAEMDKKFQSLIGTTPLKYREKNIFI